MSSGKQKRLTYVVPSENQAALFDQSSGSREIKVR